MYRVYILGNNSVAAVVKAAGFNAANEDVVYFYNEKGSMVAAYRNWTAVEEITPILED